MTKMLEPTDEDIARLESLLAAEGEPPERPVVVDEPEGEAAEPEGDAEGEPDEGEHVDEHDSEDGDAKEAAAQASPEVDKARTAIKREKLIPDRVLAEMSDEEILAAGKAARDREAERTRTWQELQDLKRQKEADEGSEASKQDPEQSGQPWDDLDPDELAKPFEDEFGEEAAKPVKLLASMVKELRGAIVARNQQELAVAEQGARREVGERFPGLLDDEVFTRDVRPQVEELAQLKSWRERYQREGPAMFPALLERAAQLADLEVATKSETEAEPSEAHLQETRRRQASTSTGPGRSGRPYSNRSADWLEGHSLAELEKNGATETFKAMTAELTRRRAKAK